MEQPSTTTESVQNEVPSNRPMTFGRFLLYATGVISAGTFSYYLYQAGGNLHKTEILIGRKLAELPFYYPPGPTVSEKNAAMPTVTISPDLVEHISAWFIHLDTVLPEGVNRTEVLDLFADKFKLINSEKPDSEFTVGDEEFRKRLSKIVEDFIEKGRGRLMEYKRLSGVSIQETVQLLDKLISEHKEVMDANIEEKIKAIISEELARLVSEQNANAMGIGSSTASAMPEVEAGEKELLEMELGQLEKTRESIIARSSNLSDAESERLANIESQLRQVQNLISKCA